MTEEEFKKDQAFVVQLVVGFTLLLIVGAIALAIYETLT